jgi:hypothetical protein
MDSRRMSRIAGALVFAAIAGTAAAQFRMDVDVMVPFKAGLVNDIQGLGGSTSSQTVNIDYAFLIPDFQALYQVDLGIVRLGGGARLFTLILESMAYPLIFAEVQLGPAVVNLNLGGLAFGFFGLANKLVTADIVVADLSAGFELAKWFRADVGFVGITPLADMNNFIGLFYAGGKFVIIPPK